MFQYYNKKYLKDSKDEKNLTKNTWITGIFSIIAKRRKLFLKKTKMHEELLNNEGTAHSCHRRLIPDCCAARNEPRTSERASWSKVQEARKRERSTFTFRRGPGLSRFFRVSKTARGRQNIALFVTLRYVRNVTRPFHFSKLGQGRVVRLVRSTSTTSHARRWRQCDSRPVQSRCNLHRIRAYCLPDPFAPVHISPWWLCAAAITVLGPFTFAAHARGREKSSYLIFAGRLGRLFARVPRKSDNRIFIVNLLLHGAWKYSYDYIDFGSWNSYEGLITVLRGANDFSASFNEKLSSRLTILIFFFFI